MHMESQRPELASNPGLCLKKKRLKLDGEATSEDFTWEGLVK